MKIIKDANNIDKEDKLLTLNILNKIRNGDRVFGNPGEGLKQTLRQLDEQHEEFLKNQSVLSFTMNDAEWKTATAQLKAGIKGEETLAEYFEKIIKYDDELQDLILFASLSDPTQNSQNLDYIPDSDFIAVYGNNILILDAKNIPTNPEIPIYLDNNSLIAAGGKELLELHPSTFVWKKIFNNRNNIIDSMKGCVVIVNQSGALIWKNPEWYTSSVQPIHISSLLDYLHDWVKDKEPTINLSLLTTLSKMQIRKESTGLDLTVAHKLFGV